jgi:hypothetical protein
LCYDERRMCWKKARIRWLWLMHYLVKNNKVQVNLEPPSYLLWDD